MLTEYRKSVKKDAEQLEQNNERIQNQPEQIRKEVQQGEELGIR